MDCRELSEMLAAYLEGVLSPEEKERVNEHLPSCHRCRTALQDLERTEELVKGLEEVEPPPWLKQRVMAQVREEGEAKRSLFRKLFYPFHVKVPLEAFATILIALVAIYVFRAIEPEIKRAEGPLTTPEVITKDQSPGESLPGKAPPAKALPPEAPDKGTPAGERGREPTKGAPQEDLKTRMDSPPIGRETLAKENLTAGSRQEAEAERVQEEAREKKERSGARIEESPIREEPGVLSQRAAPEMAPKAKDEMAGQGAVRGRVERRSLPASPSSPMAPPQRRAGAISVAVHVGNVRGAIREVETLLAELGARRIERESAETVEVVTAELQAEKLKELFERLKTVGEVKKKDGPSEIAKGEAGVRIEIIGK